MSEHSGQLLGTMGTVIERLAEMNYWICAERMTDCLLRKGLWDLTPGAESFILAHEAEDTDYKTQEEKYLAQRN